MAFLEYFKKKLSQSAFLTDTTMRKLSKVNLFEFLDGESLPIVRNLKRKLLKIYIFCIPIFPFIGASSVSPVLKNVTIAVMSNRQCRAIFRHVISGNQICTATKTTVAPCRGDRYLSH